MRYFVTIDGHTREVEVQGSRVRIDGRDAAAELLAVNGTSLRHLLVDGRSVPIVARERDGRGEWELHVDGTRFNATVLDERTHAIREMTGVNRKATGPRVVRAPMPGLIVRIEVEAGAHVSAGQPVVIIEAMKMENELKAEGSGVVSRIAVAPGQAVEKGTVLVEFEAVSAEPAT